MSGEDKNSAQPDAAEAQDLAAETPPATEEEGPADAAQPDAARVEEEQQLSSAEQEISDSLDLEGVFADLAYEGGFPSAAGVDQWNAGFAYEGGLLSATGTALGASGVDQWNTGLDSAQDRQPIRRVARSTPPPRDPDFERVTEIEMLRSRKEQYEILFHQLKATGMDDADIRDILMDDGFNISDINQQLAALEKSTPKTPQDQHQEPSLPHLEPYPTEDEMKRDAWEVENREKLKGLESDKDYVESELIRLERMSYSGMTPEGEMLKGRKAQLRLDLEGISKEIEKLRPSKIPAFKEIELSFAEAAMLSTLDLDALSGLGVDLPEYGPFTGGGAPPPLAGAAPFDSWAPPRDASPFNPSPMRSQPLLMASVNVHDGQDHQAPDDDDDMPPGQVVYYDDIPDLEPSHVEQDNQVDDDDARSVASDEDAKSVASDDGGHEEWVDDEPSRSTSPTEANPAQGSRENTRY